MQKFPILLFSVLAFICGIAFSISAQIYPIQTQVNLRSPYSGNLSDYTFSGSERITVSLHCNDITISNYRVKLRFTIEGLGITIRSKQNFAAQPLIVDGGSTLILYGDDLAEYLDPRNLDFVGFSRNEYQRIGKLPEGLYKFNVEVLDYNRNSVVSNKGFATAWILFNDVPILNLPANNTKVKIIDPVNIPFTWTPRHTGSPNSAFTTEYVFRLLEVWPGNRNPNDAFLTQTPLYEVETRQSQLVYGQDAPSLIPGRKYAWQVQARDAEGRDLFKNNGKSEVYVFQFGDAIATPENLRQEFANAKTISIRWDAASIGAIADKYRIEYRRLGRQTWYQSVTTNTWFTLTDLTQETKYEVRIRSEDAFQASEYSVAQQFATTIPKQIEGYDCGGAAPQPDSIKTVAPLLHLLPGDSFTCFDFQITVQQVTSSTGDGNFAGFGWQKVNGFNGAKIYVTFNGRINAEYILTNGRVLSESSKNTPISSLIEEMKKIGEDRKIAKETLFSDSASLEHAFEPYLIDAIVDSIFIRDDKIVVVVEEGTEHTYENKSVKTGEPVVIKDSAGTMYTVDKDGNVEKLGTNIVNGATPKNIDTANLNDFELMVKEVIDSLYGQRVAFRDSVMKIKDADQRKLDDLVGVMQSIETSVVDEVPQVELDVSVVELMTEIDLMDSTVQISVDKVNANEVKLTLLNEMLDNIKKLTGEIDNAEHLKNLGIVQRRLRITLFILNRLK